MSHRRIYCFKTIILVASSHPRVISCHILVGIWALKMNFCAKRNTVKLLPVQCQFMCQRKNGEAHGWIDFKCIYMGKKSLTPINWSSFSETRTVKSSYRAYLLHYNLASARGCLTQLKSRFHLSHILCWGENSSSRWKS